MAPAEQARPALGGGPLRVTLVRSAGPRQVEELGLSLPQGATVADALASSGWWSAGSGAVAPSVGVWGRLRPLDHLLRDLDRVELYRALRVDPKEARRERYASHRKRLRAAEALAAQRKKKGPR